MRAKIHACGTNIHVTLSRHAQENVRQTHTNESDKMTRGRVTLQEHRLLTFVAEALTAITTALIMQGVPDVAQADRGQGLHQGGDRGHVLAPTRDHVLDQDQD